MFEFVVVIIMNMMLLCSYVVFIDTSLSKHVDIRFRFSLEDKRGLSLGELIRPFCIMFLTVIYNVFIHNNAFWSNSNAFSLIICKEHTKRENSGNWKSGPGKATSGYLFCTTPNKLKLHGDFLWNT